MQEFFAVDFRFSSCYKPQPKGETFGRQELNNHTKKTAELTFYRLKSYLIILVNNFDAARMINYQIDNRNYCFLTNLPLHLGFVCQSSETFFSTFFVLTIIPATPLIQMKKNHGFDRGSLWWR